MSNITITTTTAQQPDYAGVFALRDEVLRKPLGMSLKDDDLSRDLTDIIFAAKQHDKVIGCLMLHHIDGAQLQLRQMAVDPACRGAGTGRMLVQAAEKYAVEKGYTTMVLHARQVAQGFYDTLGYTTTGPQFIEVGIPHYIMEKAL